MSDGAGGGSEYKPFTEMQEECRKNAEPDRVDAYQDKVWRLPR
jgi:hypothetical protein